MVLGLSALGEHIQSALMPQHRLIYYVINDQLVVHVDIIEVEKMLAALKRDPLCACSQLMDLCAVDYPGKEKRFQLVYNLLSPEMNNRVRIITEIGEGKIAPSAVHIYKAAPWYEREIWDMYGIHFSDHPDLRRILMECGFEGHPLRKDFPLEGFTEAEYDAELGRIKYKPHIATARPL